MTSRGGPEVPDDIMNAQALQREDDCGQTGPLDLWNRVLGHTLLPELLRINAKTLSSRGSSGAARPLLGLAPDTTKHPLLAAAFQQSRFDATRCICTTHLEIGTTSKVSIPTLELWLSCFTKPLSMMYLREQRSMTSPVSRWNDRRTAAVLLDAVNGEGCRSDVRSHNTLPYSWGGWLEDLPLLVCGDTKHTRSFLKFGEKKKKKSNSNTENVCQTSL